MTTPFSSLALTPELLANIQSLDYQTMTPIQEKSLPFMLEGRDVLAQAKTGSGKTAAFAIAILEQLQIKTSETQALVLCPTRELAAQVCKEIRRLARVISNTKIITLCGGKPIAPQLTSLAHTPHIVVGTPGRILKHLDKNSLQLDALKTLVLDEADRMLDMGFYDDIMRIINKTPPKKQTLLFSATYPAEIKKISQAIQRAPVEVHVKATHDDQMIKQVFYEIDKTARYSTLLALLQHYEPESSVIFCNRKQQCQELTDKLSQEGFHALALHGDLDQRKRDQVFLQFSNKSSSIFIATDIAARGLDVKDLEVVINFELALDPETYIHRIGRTGRAGKTGFALSLLTPSEQRKLQAIEEYQKTTFKIKKIPPLTSRGSFKLIPPMVTLCIQGGRKNKVRAGDIVGALTATTDIEGSQIGSISITDTQAYVAVEYPIAKQALSLLSNGTIKGRKFKVYKL